MHYILRGGFLPTGFSLFTSPLSYYVLHKLFIHEYLTWMKIVGTHTSCLLPGCDSGGVLEYMHNIPLFKGHPCLFLAIPKFRGLPIFSSVIYSKSNIWH
jgi:hypothetical protein